MKYRDIILPDRVMGKKALHHSFVGPLKERLRGIDGADLYVDKQAKPGIVLSGTVDLSLDPDSTFLFTFYEDGSGMLVKYDPHLHEGGGFLFNGSWFQTAGETRDRVMRYLKLCKKIYARDLQRVIAALCSLSY